MSSDPVLEGATRPRPLAELDLSRLVDAAEEIARAWALRLVRARPFAEIGSIRLDQLAREAPPLCALLVRALQSDTELERLAGREAPAEAAARGGEQSGREVAPATRLAAAAGAADPAALAGAVEALRGAVWQALLRTFAGTGAEQALPALGDRLAHVCAELLAVALSGPMPVEQEPAGAASQLPREQDARVPVSSSTGAVIVDEHRGAEGVPARAPAGSPAASSPQASPARWRERLPGAGAGGAGAIRDEDPRARPAEDPRARPVEDGRRERRPQPSEPPYGGSGHERRTGRPGPPNAAAVIDHPRPWGEPPEGPSEPQIEIRDQRTDAGPEAWLRSIGRQLERYEHDGQPFAVMLLEPLEIERLRQNESSAELARMAGEIERALVGELGMAPPAVGAGRGAAFGAAALTRQRPGRHWLLVAAADRDAAEALAERMAAAVTAAVREHGEPLRMVVGTALCPDDGRQAHTLAAHADVGLYAARAQARGRAPGA